ncbi:serine/threonine-protein kinase DCLK3-like [Pseudorasbora parva]|uniref:serine/threonine-protein kinase DCLK3-like n=1 Tax=Pseudorasbora parva TaxID=51549 RepID=UPI00351F2A1D
MALHTQDQGFFGKVYHVTIHGRESALKKVPSSFLSKEDIDRERRAYQSISHPHVVKLICDPWLDKELKWNIPLEYINGKDLEKVMFTSHTSIQLTRSVIVKIIKGMCSGLREMHRKNIIHQDLKPDNVMVEYTTHRAVIIDLGLAKFQRHGHFSGHEGGNRFYAAPEVRQGFQRDKGSDVWAMGKIIAELLITPRARLPTTVRGREVSARLSGNPYCNPVSNMVRTNPGHRATMENVMEHIKNAGRSLLH